MNACYVIGAGGHAKVVIRTLQESGCRVLAVFDDRQELHGRELLGIPIQIDVDTISEYPRHRTAIAIGDNRIRKSIADRLRLDWATVCHPSAYVDSTVTLGEGTFVMAGAVIQPDSMIGDQVIINTSASVDHDAQIASFCHVAPGVRLAGHTSLGEGVLMGIASCTTPEIRVGDWARVGAGGVVVRDVPAGVTVTGVPARMNTT